MKALDEANGHRTNASKLLGINPKTFSKLLKKFPEVEWDRLYPKQNLNNSQLFESKVFDVEKIFFVYFTLVLEWGTEIKMSTVIWAHSSKEAKQIVVNKVKEDNQWHNAKSFRTYIAHNNFKAGMGPNEWEAARYTAYPNKRNAFTKVQV